MKLVVEVQLPRVMVSVGKGVVVQDAFTGRRIEVKVLLAGVLKVKAVIKFPRAKLDSVAGMVK